MERMIIDLNEPVMDPLEVIINPANPPPVNEFLELNDFIEEIEENIPQPPAQNPVQMEEHAVEQVAEQNAQQEQPFVEGFPVPPLQDMLGEEIPLD